MNPFHMAQKIFTWKTVFFYHKNRSNFQNGENLVVNINRKNCYPICHILCASSPQKFVYFQNEFDLFWKYLLQS